jgi:hypothetical protein
MVGDGEKKFYMFFGTAKELSYCVVTGRYIYKDKGEEEGIK